MSDHAHDQRVAHEVRSALSAAISAVEPQLQHLKLALQAAESLCSEMSAELAAATEENERLKAELDEVTARAGELQDSTVQAP